MRHSIMTGKEHFESRAEMKEALDSGKVVMANGAKLFLDTGDEENGPYVCEIDSVREALTEGWNWYREAYIAGIDDMMTSLEAMHFATLESILFRPKNTEGRSTISQGALFSSDMCPADYEWAYNNGEHPHKWFGFKRGFYLDAR